MKNREGSDGKEKQMKKDDSPKKLEECAKCKTRSGLAEEYYVDENCNVVKQIRHPDEKTETVIRLGRSYW